MDRLQQVQLAITAAVEHDRAALVVLSLNKGHNIQQHRPRDEPSRAGLARMKGRRVEGWGRMRNGVL